MHGSWNLLIKEDISTSDVLLGHRILGPYNLFIIVLNVSDKVLQDKTIFKQGLWRGRKFFADLKASSESSITYIKRRVTAYSEAE